MPLPETTGQPEAKVDWEAAQRAIAAVHEKAPVILHQAVIIGGMACWFYRRLLAKAEDIDFQVADSPNEQKFWLSKDLDFTNFFAQDARDLLRENVVQDAQGRQRLIVAGVPIGFAQVGVTFDPESAYLESWIGTFIQNNRLVEFRVLDPVALYREKLSLSQRRRSPADYIHCALVANFLRYETCHQVAVLVASQRVADESAPMRFLARIKDRAPEICHDPRVRDRVQAQVAAAPNLTPIAKKLLAEIGELAQPG